MLIGCTEEDHQLGEVIAPSNIEITTRIQGQNADNPNGDGSE